jgi:DtxR family Mn-dependent transcriptional regulator
MVASVTATAVEDYLKVIYAHTEWQPEPMTSSQLAARLMLAPSSVTEMIKKLAARGLVEHVPYGAITLTSEGRKQALRMVRRHRVIETWLVRELGYGWDEVHDEAEVLEHAISDRLLDAIDDLLGRPSADPHGDSSSSRGARHRSGQHGRRSGLRCENLVRGVGDFALSHPVAYGFGTPKSREMTW